MPILSRQNVSASFHPTCMAIMLVAILGCSTDAAAALQNDDALTLGLACEPAELCWGDDLSVLASCENAGEAVTVDLYLAVVLPSGDVFYFPDGSLSSPFIAGVIIPESASFSDVEVFSGEMLAGLQAGEYLWLFAATTPGTLDVLAYSDASCRLGYDCWQSYSNLNCVSALLVSGSDLFIGLAKGGVVRHDLETYQYERYGVSDGLASSEVNDFCLDDDGNVWAALGQGQQDMDFFDEWGGISVFSNLEWTPYYPEKRSRSRNGFRDSNMFCNIAYSSADEAAYAVSHTGHIVRLGSDGAIAYVHEENNPYAQCVFAHPDGSIYACFGADDFPESQTYISRYSEGEWTEIADGGGHHCHITSDGTIWASGIDYYSDGLFRYESGFWQCVEGFEDIEVMEIAEAIGKVWILGYDGEPVLLSSVDRQDWSRLVLPSYAWNFAVSDDGALFFSNGDEGVIVYRNSEWTNLSFDGPSFARPEGDSPRHDEGPTDVAFLGDSVYFIEDSRVERFDGLSWSSLPAAPRPGTRLFIDSRGVLWAAHYTAYQARVYIQYLRDLVWNEIILEVPTEEIGRCWPCFAEDAAGKVWCHALTRAGARDPVFLFHDAGIEKYDGIREAVEANFELLCESEAKTDVWMVDKANRVVWAKFLSHDFPAIGAVASFDGDSWLWYETGAPEGTQIPVSFPDEIHIPVDIDREGWIWALTDKGLCRFNRTEVWFEPSGRCRADDLCSPLLADDYGNVWVARSSDPEGDDWGNGFGGVARFDVAKGEWEDLSEKDVPICDWIWRIRSAPNGDVWFCTWDGATRYSQGPK